MDTHTLSGSRQYGLLGSQRVSQQPAHPLNARSLSRAPCRQPVAGRRFDFSVRAEGEDQDFEDKLAQLRKARGSVPYGQSRKDAKAGQSKPSEQQQQPKYDFSDEKLHFESPPHRGDLATNVALGATLLWLPLTIAAVGRAIFINYRFTDKRLSVITTAPWKNEQLDAPYQEVKEVVTVGRGIGLWGDMVVTLRNNDKIELRSVPKFLELKKYILERKEALTKQSLGDRPVKASTSPSPSPASKKGFS